MSLSVSNPPGPVSTVQSYLIASALGVNANSLATTVMNWGNGLTAANTLPLFARILGRSGTFALMVANLRLNSVIIQPITALNAALLGSGSDPINYPLSTAISSTVIPAQGNWDIVVGTINGSAATLDVLIFGLKIA